MSSSTVSSLLNGKGGLDGVLDCMSNRGVVTTRDEMALAIEAGTFYKCSDTVLLSENDSMVLAVEVGDLPAAITQLHIIAQSEAINVSVYENSVVTTSGMAQCFNVNRLIPDPDPEKNSSVLIVTGITDVGDLLMSWDLVGQDAAGSRKYLKDDLDGLVVFKPQTTYLVVLTNTAAISNAPCQLMLDLIDR